MVTTPPTKKEMNTTMPSELTIKSSNSFKTNFRIIDAFVGLLNTCFSIIKYEPISSRYFMQFLLQTQNHLLFRVYCLVFNTMAKITKIIGFKFNDKLNFIYTK